MALSLLFFSAQFDIPYSILFVRVALSHFSKFKIIVVTIFLHTMFFVPKKRFSIPKLLRTYYVRRLSVSYRMNVRTSQKMLGVHR